MLRQSAGRLLQTTNLTVSRDFGKMRPTAGDQMKENQDTNFDCRMIQSVRLGSNHKMDSQTMEQNTSRHQGLQCREDFMDRDDVRNYDDDYKRKAFASQRSYSQSQENFGGLKQSTLGRLQGTGRPSFYKQQIVRKPQVSDFRPSLQNKPNQALLKSSSSTNDIKSFCSQRQLKESQASSMLDSKALPNTVECANKDGKKAKYRIVNSEEDQQQFYCSKCSIMLLQQGFHVEQLEQTWCQPNINKVLRRKSQIERLSNITKKLQKNMKNHANKLQDNSYFQTIDQEKQKIAQCFDYFIVLLEQMKSMELQKLQKSKEVLVNQIQKQKASLFGKFTRLQSVRDELEEVGKMVSRMKENDYASVVNDCLQIIGEGENYEPLQLSIRVQNPQIKIDKILNQLQEHFKEKRIQGIQFSFDKHETPSQSRQSSERSSHPFRNLFSDQSGPVTAYKGLQTFRGNESIKECYEESFASNASMREND